MKALLLCAGLGTRLKPFTDQHPKALATVGGITLLEWNIRNLQRFGVFDIVVNVHHFAGQIVDLLHRENGFGSRVEISDETDQVLETGGGLKKAAAFFAGQPEFIVLNVDVLGNYDLNALLEHHRQHRPLATLAVQQRNTSRYFLFNEHMALKGWENVQTGVRKLPGSTADKDILLRRMAFSGLQVLDQHILRIIRLEGKFSLVDLYLDLCADNTILGWDHTQDILLDVGKPESLARASALRADGTLKFQ